MDPKFTEVSQLFDRFKAAFLRNDFDSASNLLSQLKVLLTGFRSLPPLFADTPNAVQELTIARDIYEHAVVLGVKIEDQDAFERDFFQLKPYHTDARNRLPQSPQEYPILGLNLLRLLVQNRIAEFHTELELLSSTALENPCIKHAVELEQSFMEGAYNRVLSARQTVPHETYVYFMDLAEKLINEVLAEGGENILDAINYEEDDVEMVDVEEGELVEEEEDHGVAATQDHNLIHESDSKNINQKPKPLSKNRKRKNKRKRKVLGSDGPIDINRFVIETCRRLKEKKSYMVYTAVGCLGVSALSDIVKEVDAIQSCGGQQTADGKRFRTGGGVLWNIIKVREPNAYKEIMKKAREFEKQFRQPSFKQPSVQKEEDSSQEVPCTFSSAHQGHVSDNPTCASQMQDQDKPPGPEKKRVLVHDRLRIPVSYDDDLLGASVDNDVTLP